MSDTAFTLEINEKYTRLVDAKYANKTIELTAAGIEQTFPHFFTADDEKVTEKQAEIITKLCTNLKIKKKEVQVVIPDGFTYSQIVEMPRLKEKELLAAIRYQADEFIPMPIDETSIDLEILREDPKARKVLILIVASPKKIVNRLEKTMEAAGFMADSLENELSAAGRILSEVIKPAGAVSLVVNFGYSHSSIYLVDGSSTLILLARTVNVGLELVLKDLVVNLNWEEQKVVEALKTIGLNPGGSVNIEGLVSPILKELFHEMEKIMILARDRFAMKVDHIYLYNFESHIAGLPKKTESYFSLPSQTLPVQQFIKQSPIAQSFSKDLSSFVSVLSGSIR